MGDMGDIFRAVKQDSKDRKAYNATYGRDKLKENNIAFEELSDSHLKVESFDYWPSTGLFIHKKTKKRGRGVHNLIKAVRHE